VVYASHGMNEQVPVEIEPAYSSPVDTLLRRGNPGREADWPDYQAMGFRLEHIPELIRMATDEELNNAPGESPEVWAPLHAWRTLGQLRAEAAIEPLLGLFKRIDEHDDDWVLDDLPRAFGKIGPDALPALSAYLAGPERALVERQAAGQSIVEIGRSHPESRDDCVVVLVGQLDRFTENGRSLNGSLVSLLLDLEAVEAAPVMEQAFAAGQVDESVAGDWEDVQIELGLRDKRSTPATYAAIPGFRTMSDSERQRSFLKLISTPDLKAIQKAEKKARSEAKKAKWKSLLQRQKRR
jgi:hypothetical protein